MRGQRAESVPLGVVEIPQWRTSARLWQMLYCVGAKPTVAVLKVLKVFKVPFPFRPRMWQKFHPCQTDIKRLLRWVYFPRYSSSLAAPNPWRRQVLAYRAAGAPVDGVSPEWCQRGSAPKPNPFPTENRGVGFRLHLILLLSRSAVSAVSDICRSNVRHMSVMSPPITAPTDD